MANVLEIIIAAKDQATKQIGGVRKGLGDLATGMKNLTVAVAAVYGPLAAGLGFALKKTVDYGVQLDDLMKKTGVSAESLARLGYAAEQEGSSINGVAMAFKFLGMRMVDAEDGLMEAKRAFDRMGLTITDSQGKFKDLEDMLMEVAGRFPELGSEAEKTSVAMDLFGRSGVELIPLLNKGQGAIRELMEEADSLGIVMSTDMAKRTKVFADKMTVIKEGLRGFAITIGTEVMPIVQEWVQYMIDHMPEIQKFSKRLAEGIRDYAADLKVVIGYVFQRGEAEERIGKMNAKQLQTRKIALSDEKAAIFDTQDALKEKYGILAKGTKQWILSNKQLKGIAEEEELIHSRAIELLKKKAEVQKKTTTEGIKGEKDAAEVRKEILTKDEEAALKRQENIEKMRDRLLEFYEWDAEQRGLRSEDILVKIEERLVAEEEGTERYLALVEARTFLQKELETESADKIAMGWKSSFGKINSYSLEFGKILGSVTNQATKQFGTAMEGMIMDGKNFKEAFDSFFKDLARSFIRAVSEMIAKWLAFKAISGIFGGGFLPMPSMEGGGPVLRTGPIMAHEGEHVLSVPTVRALEQGRMPLGMPAPAFAGAGPTINLTVNVSAERGGQTLPQIAEAAREGTTEAIEASLLMKRLADANEEFAA